MKKYTSICFSLILAVLMFNSMQPIRVQADSSVKLGIDNIDYNLELFKGKKVGLITNKTGVNRSLTSSIDILKEKTILVKLFAPEHGVRGDSEAGSTIKDDYDSKSGLKIYSLYGNTKKPTAEMLSDIDVLAYDIQDVGARFYTYISTLAYAMQACAENNKTFVVFDRPNPISGEAVEGPILDTKFSSFVGMYPIAQRYGLTVGEIAKLINKEYGINSKLVVIPMSNWTRNMYYEDTGLKTWVAPSPNIPTVDTAIVYSGTCIFEGTNVSEGRGTPKPFQYIGAPYINGEELAAKMNSLKLKGVSFKAVKFTPTTSKYSSADKIYKNSGDAVECQGVDIEITDRAAFRPVRTSISLLYTIKDMYKASFKFNSDNYIDKLWGNSNLREGIYSLAEIKSIIEKDEESFKTLQKSYYIYGNIPRDLTNPGGSDEKQNTETSNKDVMASNNSNSTNNKDMNNYNNSSVANTNTDDKVVNEKMDKNLYIYVIIALLIIIMVFLIFFTNINKRTKTR